MAAESGERCDVLIDGYALGSLSMTTYTVGVELTEPASDGAAAGVPALGRVPPEDTNL